MADVSYTSGLPPLRFTVEGAGSIRALSSSRVALLMAAAGVDHFADFSWSTGTLGGLDTFEARLREGFPTLTRHYTNLNGWFLLNPPHTSGSYHIFQTALGEEPLFLTLEISNGEPPTVQAMVSARAVNTIAEALRILLGLFPPYVEPVRKKEPKQFVNFWMSGTTGPTATARLLDVVTWEGIANNYANSVRRVLTDIAAPTYSPQKSGQIMLFTGPPGCGKTFSIRALAWEWQRWCTIQYVMDAPALFSGSPAYIHALLFGKEERPPLRAFLELEPSEEPPVPAHERWRLIVLEDSGELIADDAKEQTGQGLARLLNAADGLLGQGSRVIFLITTNEPLEKLHPAVVRPGRCAANITFTPLSAQESNVWLAEQGSTEVVSDPQTIAELYARVGQRPMQTGSEKGRRVGFK